MTDHLHEQVDVPDDGLNDDPWAHSDPPQPAPVDCPDNCLLAGNAGHTHWRHP